jgi:hypothetical protein
MQNCLKQAVWIGVLLSVGFRSGASIPLPGRGSADWVTGREALQNIMQTMKEWFPDAEVIRLYSGQRKKAPREGVCDEWRTVVLSRSRKKSTGFYWRGRSVAQSEVTDYEPDDKQSPVEAARIKADSDAAFRMAEEHGGKPLLGKNPETDIRYAMMFDRGLGQLTWLVFYDIKGNDISTAKLHAAINAETGEFIR